MLRYSTVSSSYHRLITADQKTITSCSKKTILEFPGNLGLREGFTYT